MVAARPGDQAGDQAWERALELAWESFCGGTTPAAGPHVLAAQQEALPDQAALAARPATQRLLAEAAAARVPLPDLRTALRGTL